MNAESEKHCTLLIHFEKASPPTSEEIAQRLENKNGSTKAAALEELIRLMINGESYPKLLMTIIRFVVTCNDHRVKKLLMIYWEVVEKTKEDGDLKEEMILVCNALRNDLMHPNEYVRGSTLRLLCKMKYYRVLEPLKEAVLRNLSHRHSYVRRNAVMCVYSVVKSFGLEVMPEAPEDVEQLLLVEGDLSTKRNAFLMLLHCDQERAMKYVLSMQDQVTTMGDIFQLAVLELARRVCRSSPTNRGRCLRIVLSLVQSSSTAVCYDCASSLVALSSSPLAIHQATSAYVTLLTEQSDNNVKLIVLDRLQDVKKHHRTVMEGMTMDILRALSCPSLDVRKKVLDICLGSLVSPRNIKDVVGFLKKEVVKTLGYEAQNTEGNLEYRRLLIRALHACTAQFAEHAQGVCFLLMDFLTEADQSTASEVTMFLQELIAGQPQLRTAILQRLAEMLGDMQQSRVLRGCLWLLGEFAEDDDLIDTILTSVLTSIKPFPLVQTSEDSAKKPSAETSSADKEKKPASAKMTTKTVVQADGTYGQQIVYEKGEDGEEATTTGKEEQKKSPLRGFLVNGDLLLTAMLGTTVTKLALKTQAMPEETRNEVLFMLANLVKLSGQKAESGERSGSSVRLLQCIRAILAARPAGPGSAELMGGQLQAAQLMANSWSSGKGRDQLAKVLELASKSSEWTMGSQGEEEGEQRLVQPDEALVFRQLRERKGALGEANTIDDDDFSAATGSALAQSAADGALFAERLAKARQLTGLADAVYVEAFLQIHSFDLVLELLIVNRTSEVLQNVLVELSTQGDLKMVDRPAAVTLAPGQQMTVSASIKVSSTEAGVIFGYVSYEKKSASDKECCVLNELHVDILDYIERAWIGELAFRTMWSEFEWENKINIATSITEVGEYLGHIMRNTNMSIVGQVNKKKAGEKGTASSKRGRLSEEEVKDMIRESQGIQTLIESSSFVAVNLYAKSIFGEDALANVSIEKLPDGKLTGSVRIRSRTQGVALSLGDRVTIVQRGSSTPKKK